MNSPESGYMPATQPEVPTVETHLKSDIDPNFTAAAATLKALGGEGNLNAAKTTMEVAKEASLGKIESGRAETLKNLQFRAEQIQGMVAKLAESNGDANPAFIQELRTIITIMHEDADNLQNIQAHDDRNDGTHTDFFRES